MTVGIAGTGGGFKKFCRGETDISDASRPILKTRNGGLQTAPACKFFELPIAYDALTVIVNPKNDWVKADDRAGFKKDVGTGSPGQNHKLEPSPFGMAQRSAEAFRTPARTPEPLTILPKRSWARQSRAAAISRPVRMITCWFKASLMIATH